MQYGSTLVSKDRYTVVLQAILSCTIPRSHYSPHGIRAAMTDGEAILVGQSCGQEPLSLDVIGGYDDGEGFDPLSLQ